MIRLENVTKVYDGGVVALKDIDLDINKGEFVFLVGPSGSGKSTLIRLMMREEKPSCSNENRYSRRDLLCLRCADTHSNSRPAGRSAWRCCLRDPSSLWSGYPSPHPSSCSNENRYSRRGPLCLRCADTRWKSIPAG